MDFSELMRSGRLYSCRDMTPDVRESYDRTQDLIYEYNQCRAREWDKRCAILKEMIPDLGEGACIEPPFYLTHGSRLHVGKHFYANWGATIVNDIDVYIGDNVMFATNVSIAVTGHPVHHELRPRANQFSFPVRIGNNVWIGTNVVILPGVTIGDNAVIGAGSVVTKDIPANTVAVGVPCKVIREITDRDKEYYYRDMKITEEELARL